MVFIRETTDFAKDDDLVVFPPINHENLYMNEESPSESSFPSSSSRLSDSSSSSSLSPSDSDGIIDYDRETHSQPSETNGKSPPSVSRLRVDSLSSRWKSLYYSIDITRCWWKLLLVQVLSKFQNFVTCLSSNSLCSFSKTFYPFLGIVFWWWMRHRTRRRIHEGEIADHLRNTIKEKDEMIFQLLHQISQMNELLAKIKHSN